MKGPVLFVDAGSPHDPAALWRAAEMHDVAGKRRRLERLAGTRCLYVPFSECNPSVVADTAARAIVIGGRMTPWGPEDTERAAGLLEVIRTAPAPILGICQGHQLIGLAHGVEWRPVDAAAARNCDSQAHPVRDKTQERGLGSVVLDPRSRLFAGMDPVARVYQWHSWQVPDCPSGFLIRARTACTPIQAMERLDRPVFGVQFHPEEYSPETPDGRTILLNFFSLGIND